MPVEGERHALDDYLTLCAAYIEPAFTGGALWPESLCIRAWLTSCSSYKGQALQRLRCCYCKKAAGFWLLEGTQIQLSAVQGTSKGVAPCSASIAVSPWALSS